MFKKTLLASTMLATLSTGAFATPQIAADAQTLLQNNHPTATVTYNTDGSYSLNTVRPVYRARHFTDTIVGGTTVTAEQHLAAHVSIFGASAPVIVAPVTTPGAVQAAFEAAYPAGMRTEANWANFAELPEYSDDEYAAARVGYAFDAPPAVATTGTTTITVSTGQSTITEEFVTHFLDGERTEENLRAQADRRNYLQGQVNDVEGTRLAATEERITYDAATNRYLFNSQTPGFRTLALAVQARADADEADLDAANQLLADGEERISYRAETNQFVFAGNGYDYITNAIAARQAADQEAQDILDARPDVAGRWSAWTDIVVPAAIPAAENVASVNIRVDQERTRNVVILGVVDNPALTTREAQTITRNVPNPAFTTVAARSFNGIEYDTVALRASAEADADRINQDSTRTVQLTATSGETTLTESFVQNLRMVVNGHGDEVTALHQTNQGLQATAQLNLQARADGVEIVRAAGLARNYQYGEWQTGAVVAGPVTETQVSRTDTRTVVITDGRGNVITDEAAPEALTRTINVPNPGFVADHSDVYTPWVLAREISRTTATGPENQAMVSAIITEEFTRSVEVNVRPDVNPLSGPLSEERIRNAMIPNPAFTSVESRTFNGVEYETIALRNAAEEHRAHLVDQAALEDDFVPFGPWTIVEGSEVQGSYDVNSKSKYVTIPATTITKQQTATLTINGDIDAQSAAFLAEVEADDELSAVRVNNVYTITATRAGFVIGTPRTIVNPAWTAANNKLESDLASDIDYGTKLEGKLANGDMITLNLSTLGIEYARTYTLVKDDNTFYVTPRAVAGGFIGGDAKYVGAGVDVNVEIKQIKDALVKAGIDSGTFVKYWDGEKDGFKGLEGSAKTDARAYLDATKDYGDYTINARVATDGVVSAEVKKGDFVFGANSEGQLNFGYSVKF